MAERKKDDRLLDEYLGGDSPLSRAYRETGREEPPAHLDAAILAQAKVALGTRRKPRWFMPLSLAATVVLSIGVVLLLSREGVTPMPMETPLPTPGAPVLKPTTPAVIEKAPVVTPKVTVTPKEVPAVTPKEAPRFEPREVVIPPNDSRDGGGRAASGTAAEKPPETWFAEIEALRKAGKHAEADAEMAKFRQRYPDYSIKP